MSANAQVVFQAGTLPSPYCFTTWQSFVNALVGGLTGYLPGNYSTFNFGNSVPAVGDQDKPWIRLNVDGSPDRVYVFFNGQWVSPNPYPAQAVNVPGMRLIWTGSASDLNSFDGGDNMAPDFCHGPMWEIDTAFAGRMPMGPGVIPDDGSTLAVATDYGNGTRVLVQNQLPDALNSLQTSMALYRTFSASGPAAYIAARNIPPANELIGDGTPNTESNSMWNFLNAGGNQPVNFIPPVYGAYFIKRTNRGFYRV